MTRKTKQIMARILAVVMAVTLIPSNMWGTVNVVMAEETSEAFTGEDADVTAEDVQEPQEEADEKENVVVDDETETSVTGDADEMVEDEKKTEKKEMEKVSAETDNKDAVTYVHDFTKNGKESAYYTISGNLATNKGSASYNGVTFTTCLKAEDALGVTFTAVKSGKLLLVSIASGQIKVDETKYTANSEGIITVELEAGQHTLAKGNTSGHIFYIVFTTEAAVSKDPAVAPTATPVSGSVVKINDVITLSSTSTDAEIYYTMDGSDPKAETDNTAAKYSEPIAIIDDMENEIVIKAYACGDNYEDSATQTFTYTVSKEPVEGQLKLPTATPEKGEVARGTTVTLACGEGDDGASIYYTVDGTTPNKDSSTLYKNPIEIKSEMLIGNKITIKAIAVKEGFTTSNTATFEYTIKKPTISSGTTAESIISSIKAEDTVLFKNQAGEEVFNIQLKAEALTTPESAVRTEAEKIKVGDGKILYYDFTLVNADKESDTVTLTGGKVTIKMPYAIVTPAASRLNDIFVLHGTDQVEVTKETDGFSFNADSFSPYTVIINPMSTIKEDISITDSAGYEEGAYAEWETVEGADGYIAYVAKADGEYIRIDDELIREYKDYWRVDTVGLAKGTYYIKIDAVVLGKDNEKTTATVIGTGTTRSLKVTSHDRSGYAWVNGTSSGAYNEDGTLRSNANVIYVTEETKDTVSLDVVTNKNGSTTPCEGVIAILAGYKKGQETRPLALRFIGNITDFEGIDGLKECKGDIVVDGTAAGVTIEGIGEDSVANGWGIRIKGASNVEIRNLAFMNCNSDEGDDVGLQQDNDHVWVHHCDMFYGNAGSDADQVKGDGALDVKLSTYVTFSYNHFWDSGKCNLAGLKGETTEMRLTYHHNWYDHSDSRHPRIRFFTTHVYNNYYDGNAKYGVGSALGGPSVFVENNYFRNCPYPMLISMQGSDVWNASKNANDYGEKPTFSKEDGGIIKAYGNIIEGAKRFIPYSATDDPNTAWDESVDFDAYVVKNRTDTVPASVKTVAGVSGLKGSGGNTYSNFDTAPDFYDYTPDDAEDVPTIVMAGAGRVNGGDFKWEFDDAVEDSNYAVIPDLKTAIVNYQSLIKAIGGNVPKDITIVEGDDSPAPGDDSVDVAKPTIETTIIPGEVKKGTKVTVTLNCETANSEIYYTINGGNPSKNSTHYADPFDITITGNTVIRVIAYVGDDYSNINTCRYTIPDETGDQNESESTLVTNPSEPESEPGPKPSEPESEPGPKPSEPESEPGPKPSEPESEPSSETPDVKIPLSNPEAVPAPKTGVTYPVNIEIALISKEKGTVYYTTDGTEPKKQDGTPSEKSKKFSAAEPIKLSTEGTHTIKAFAVKEGYLPSETATFTYTVSANSTMKQLAEPTIAPASKEVEKGEKITVTITKAEDDPEGTEIYYTTDGTAPTKEATRYTGEFTLTIDKTTTINAIAVKDGAISSTTASVTYTVEADDTETPPAGVGLRVVLKNKNEVYTYTGSAIKPDIVVWNYNDKLVEGIDYTVTYKNNINATTEETKANKKPQIIVTGKGNLTGKATETFDIKARTLNNVVVSGVEKVEKSNDADRDNLLVVENTKPAPVLYYGGVKLNKKDYTVSVTDKCTAGDTGKDIKITGQGNYTGELNYKLKVIAKDQLKKFTVTFSDPGYTYNGSSQTLTFANDAVKDSSKTDTDGKALTKDTDYTIVYQNDTTNAGKVKFTVVGLGIYTGAVTKTYTIKPIAETSGFAFTGVGVSYPYAAAGVTIPTAGITYKGISLEQGKDYKLTYGNNKKAGTTAKISAVFMGNYKGSKIDPVTFAITQGTLNNQTEGLKIAIADKVYNKPGVYKSVPYVSVNGVEVKSSEYTVKYYTGVNADGSIDANTEMGSKNKIELSETEKSKKVYVELTGKGKNYADTMKLTASYNVYKADNAMDLSKAKITVYKDWTVSDLKDKNSMGNKMEYTGVEIEPGVMIEFKDANKTTLSPQQVKTLIDENKITVQYTNNVNKGKATIVINGNGTDYVGGKTATFSITMKNLKDTDVLVNLFKNVNNILKG